MVMDISFSQHCHHAGYVVTCITILGISEKGIYLKLGNDYHLLFFNHIINLFWSEHDDHQ